MTLCDRTVRFAYLFAVRFPTLRGPCGNKDEFDADKVILPPNCVDNKGTRELFRRLLAEIRALDNQVGDVLKTIEEVGKLDNTLVVFLGEQGPQLPGRKMDLLELRSKQCIGGSLSCKNKGQIDQ